MSTDNRNYTEVPPLTAPDVPYWVNQALNEIDADVQGVDAAGNSLAVRVTATEAKNADQDTTLAGHGTRLTAVEAKNTSQDTVQADHSSRLTAVEAKNTAQDTTNTTQDGRLTAVEAKNTAQDTTNTTQDGRLVTLEADKYKKPFLAGDRDLFTVTETGVYPLIANITNWAAQNYPANFKGDLVVENTAGTDAWRVFKGGSVAAPRVWVQWTSGGVAGSWLELTGYAAADAANLTAAKAYADGLNYIKPFVAGTVDLWTVKTAGKYPMIATITDWAAQHYPVNSRGHLTVDVSNTWVFHTYRTAAPTPQTFTSYFNGATWTAWKEETPDKSYVDRGVGLLGIRHQLLKDDLEAYYGGPVGTAGAAPVALTFDDYPRDFRDHMRAELNARNIPYTLALSSRMYDPAAIGAGTWGAVYDGAAGTTWAEINGWLTTDKAEAANHGATHNGTSTLQGLYDEIVQGHIDLSANLPARPIWTWIQPSATYDAGFNVGNSIDSYATTLAGKYILDRHALATGVRTVNGLNRVPRRGRPVQGLTRSCPE